MYICTYVHTYMYIYAVNIYISMTANQDLDQNRVISFKIPYCARIFLKRIVSLIYTFHDVCSDLSLTELIIHERLS